MDLVAGAVKCLEGATCEMVHVIIFILRMTRGNVGGQALTIFKVTSDLRSHTCRERRQMQQQVFVLLPRLVNFQLVGSFHPYEASAAVLKV